jgi:hypothetical protein
VLYCIGLQAFSLLVIHRVTIRRALPNAANLSVKSMVRHCEGEA